MAGASYCNWLSRSLGHCTHQTLTNTGRIGAAVSFHGNGNATQSSAIFIRAQFDEEVFDASGIGKSNAVTAAKAKCIC